MRKEELNAQRNRRSHYRQVNEGRKRRSELFDIAKASSEPVVEVCAAKYRLNGFQKDYAIYYKRYVRGSVCGRGKKKSCPVA